MSRVEVETQSEDGLSGEVWTFYVHSESEMWLNAFARVSRPSKRHKWAVKEHWSRLSDRTAKITKSELKLTPEIMSMAKRAYIERLEKNLVVSIRD